MSFMFGHECGELKGSTRQAECLANTGWVGDQRELSLERPMDHGVVHVSRLEMIWSGIGAREAAVQSTRRTREELRTTLVEEGRLILLTEGLETGSSNLTFKRVFDRVEANSGLRITNASVIGRIWENQADFQADVLVTIARDESRRAQVSGQRVVNMLSEFDLSSPESRNLALREVCRIEGNASSVAMDQSANWELWIGVIALAASTATPELQSRIKAAIAAEYRSVTRFWSQNFTALVGLLGYRARSPWSMDHFASAAIAYAEGCALRQLADRDMEMVIRPTGANGEDQEWSAYATGMEALVGQYLEADPEFIPPVGVQDSLDESAESVGM